MEAVFLKIVNMSINASWLVLAVLIVRHCLNNAPKSLRCILWAFVGLRLVLPFSLESAVSLIPSKEPLPQEFLYAAAPRIDSGISVVNRVLNPVIAQSLAPAPLTSANPTQILSFVFSQVWILGMVFMAIYGIISFCVIRRKVRVSISLEKSIRICDAIDTPFILGLYRPVIYLPSALDDFTAEMVLAHEKAHLRRKDHWWKPLGFALLTVYWFNPLMWLAYILLCRDIELACDEKVIKELGENSKKAYSTALLQCSLPRHAIAACPLAFGEVGVKERVKSILSYKKPAFWIVVTAVITCIAFGICFLTDPKTTESDNWEAQCRDTFAQLQKTDTYHIRLDSRFLGVNVLNDSSYIHYYGNTGTQLKVCYIPADNSTVGYMVDNGTAYESITYNGTFSWYEYDKPDPESAVPWILDFDFDAQDVDAIARSSTEDGYYIRLKIHEKLEEHDMSAGSYHADLHFSAQGELLRIERKVHIEGNTPAVFFDMTQVWTIADTSVDEIENTIECIRTGSAIIMETDPQLRIVPHPQPSLAELLATISQDRPQLYLSFHQESNAAGKQAFNAWNTANADAYAKKLLDYTFNDIEGTDEVLWKNKDYYVLYRADNGKWTIVITEEHILLLFRNRVYAYQAEPRETETIPIYALISKWYEEASQQS